MQGEAFPEITKDPETVSCTRRNLTIVDTPGLKIPLVFLLFGPILFSSVVLACVCFCLLGICVENSVCF